MLKVGEPVDGYCKKCRNNSFMNISATDGREVFEVTCRTCHTQQPFQPELSHEELRARALKKLERGARKKVVTRRRAPVINRRRSDADTPKATRRRSSRSEVVPGASRRVINAGTPTQRPEVAPKKAVVMAPKRELPPEVVEARAKWKELTSKLSSRHGKPYYPDRTYAEGDVMLHKRHGMGVVESVVDDTACVVLFRDGREQIDMAQPPTR